MMVDKDQIELFRKLKSKAQDDKIERHKTNSGENVFIDICNKIGFKPDETYYDGAEAIYMLRLVKGSGKYELVLDKISLAAACKGLEMVAKDQLKLYLVANRKMVNPVLQHEYGFYNRNGNQVKSRIQEEDFDKDEITIDQEQAIVRVYYGVKKINDEVQVLDDLFKNILSNEQYEGLLNWLSIFTYESRANKRKPILVVNGDNADLIIHSIKSIFPNSHCEMPQVLAKGFKEYKQWDAKTAIFTVRNARYGKYKITDFIDLFNMASENSDLTDVKAFRNNGYPVLVLPEKHTYKTSDFIDGAEVLFINAKAYTEIDLNKEYIKELIEENIGTYVLNLHDHYLKLVLSADNNNQYGIKFSANIIKAKYRDCAKWLVDIYELPEFTEEHYKKANIYKVSLPMLNKLLDYFKETKRLPFFVLVAGCKIFNKDTYKTNTMLMSDESNLSTHYTFAKIKDGKLHPELQPWEVRKRFCCMQCNWKNVLAVAENGMEYTDVEIDEDILAFEYVGMQEFPEKGAKNFKEVYSKKNK